MYPETTSTGLYVSEIASDLARLHRVGVLCGRPTYAAQGTPVPWAERWRGVNIRRCVATAFPKDGLAGRLLNLVTLSLSIGIRAFRDVARTDLMLVFSNPPVLPHVVAWACRLRGCRYIVVVHDRYPDTLLAVTPLTESSLVVRAGWMLERRLLRRAEQVVVVGRDMREAIARRHPSVAATSRVIPNWGETDLVRPGLRSDNPLLRSLGLLEHFVVLYAGNFGRPNDIDTVIEAARRLRNDARFRFLFVGTGAKLGAVKDAARSGRLDNITVLGSRPRQEQPVFLNACDLGVVPLVRGMKGVAVPSRLYNLLAAGKPILALAEEGSEVDLVVREENVGWVAPPGDVDQCVAAIREAASDPARLEEMGVRARAAAERRFTADVGLAAYRDLVEGVPGFGARA